MQQPSVGTKLQIRAPDGKLVTAEVPRGCSPGSVFEVVIPMHQQRYTVTVPAGATAGSRVPIRLPDGSTVEANVPTGLSPGMTFDVLI